jgi:DGQHR domain-containing protein
MNNLMEDPISFSFQVLKLKQPIGDFFVGSMDWKRLCDITHFDVRRILREREFETYLGIQRRLNEDRVQEIQQYVKTVDACFPTSVILSIPGNCARYDAETAQLTLSNYIDDEDSSRSIGYRQIAKVIDGQHRIEGLKNYSGPAFDVSVSIFVEIDVAEEAYLFSTVNLAQTKVNKSLAYDLFDYARARSPQKLAHNIAVALDQDSNSPFFKRIKRLGVATEGRFNETITQATFVEALMAYLSANPVADRDLYMRGKTPPNASASELRRLIFRNMMIEQEDLKIADVLLNYFGAVRSKWPTAWSATGSGQMLNKTNGFRALMRFLRPVYLYLVAPGEVPSEADFSRVFSRFNLRDTDFTIERFRPGTSGEGALYHALLGGSGIDAIQRGG